MTDLHVILFPYLLYPAMNVVMSASICMTAAIALERYIAVHYPIGKFWEIRIIISILLSIIKLFYKVKYSTATF